MSDSIFEYAKMMFPQYNEETIDFMVWENTSYPFLPIEECKKQLEALKIDIVTKS